MAVCLVKIYKLNPFVSLAIIGVILAGSIAASFIWRVKGEDEKV